MTLDDIGEDGNALLCLTDNRACCGRAQTGGFILGDWYYPNSTEVPNLGNGRGFYRNRGQSVVRMHHRRDEVTGIFHCVIPDATGVNQTIYIGVYTASTGEWYIWTESNEPNSE